MMSILNPWIMNQGFEPGERYFVNWEDDLSVYWRDRFSEDKILLSGDCEYLICERRNG